MSDQVPFTKSEMGIHLCICASLDSWSATLQGSLSIRLGSCARLATNIWFFVGNLALPLVSIDLQAISLNSLPDLSLHDRHHLTIERISPQLWLGWCHAQLDWADIFAKALGLLVHEVMFRPTQCVHDTLAYAYVWLRHSLWYQALGRSCWWPALHILESIMWLDPTSLHATPHIITYIIRDPLLF